jgi:hypothetical protein
MEAQMRKEMINALKNHAVAHIEKHRMNVEVYLNNPVGVGEHSDIMDTIEKELNAIAEYHDQLEILNTYFND